MELTKRQALFLITICFVANKVQRLPSLVSSALGRHGFLVFFAMGVIDVLFLLLALLFNKNNGGKTTYQICKTAGGKFYAKIIYVLLGIYYLANALLPYEAVHDLFANILFDFLSWETYSLVFAITVFFVANRRLKNIGRLGEIFYYTIALSFIVLLVLGATTTNYQRTLPFADLEAKMLIDTCLTYSLWFGDFLIIYMIVGKVKEEGKKLGWQIILMYSICVIVISFAYIVFYGLYEHLSPSQNSLISSISQFSLLNLEIGRIDWFFVLFFQIGTVVASGVYLHLASQSFQEVFGIKDKKYIVLVLVALIYIADIFVFKSIQEGVSIIAFISKYFAISMILFMPIILLITEIVANKKTLKKYNFDKYQILYQKNKQPQKEPRKELKEKEAVSE